VGQDADLGACQSIVEGTQLMTVYKPIYKLAVHAAELAVDIALGQQTEPDSFLDNGSGVDIPFYVESPIAVYKDDMDEVIIADGFHSKEDVYRTGLVQN
jgi:D-xylose transport system substrate-binding protein